MKHQRAIVDSDKEERRGKILEAASRLLDEIEYEQVSIQAVANSTGIAKGTVYLYFQTKEELFLALLGIEFQSWFADLNDRLDGFSARGQTTSIPEIAGVFWATLAGHPRLLRLIPILHPVLERNLSFPAALTFKKDLLDNLITTGSLIEQTLNQAEDTVLLQPGQGAEFLMLAYAQLIDLQSMADPSPLIQSILEEPAMQPLRVDISTALPRALTLLLEGYRAAI